MASNHKGAIPSAVESKTLKQENKRLKKELNRKEKALAEAAALLILQKKSTSYGGTTRKTHYE